MRHNEHYAGARHAKLKRQYAVRQYAPQVIGEEKGTPDEHVYSALKQEPHCQEVLVCRLVYSLPRQV